MLIDTNGSRIEVPTAIEPKKDLSDNSIIQNLGIVLFNGKMIVRQATIMSKWIHLPKGSAEIQKAEGYILGKADDVDHLEVGDYIVYGKYGAWEIPEGEGGEDNLYIVDAGDVLYKKNKPNTEDTNV